MIFPKKVVLFFPRHSISIFWPTAIVEMLSILLLNLDWSISRFFIIYSLRNYTRCYYRGTFFYQKSNLKWNHWWWNSKGQKQLDVINVYNQMNRYVCCTKFLLAIRTGLSLTLPTPCYSSLSRRWWERPTP